jgi:hypothetical protein
MNIEWIRNVMHPQDVLVVYVTQGSDAWDNPLHLVALALQGGAQPHV